MKIIYTIALMMIAVLGFGQSSHSLLRSGDRAYLDGQYLSAEEDYRKANDDKPSLKGEFNLGNAVYQQERYEEALQHYESTAASAKTDEEKANALYNLGNAQLKLGQLDPAIESYKKAYDLNPEDRDILKNLYIAKLLMQQEQQQQQEQEQQDQQEKDDQNQEQQQQQEQQQDQQEQQEQQDSQSAQSDPSEESPENQESQPAESQNLSKEDAMKLLDVIENEEKAVQEKLRKGKGGKKKPKKDW